MSTQASRRRTSHRGRWSVKATRTIKRRPSWPAWAKYTFIDDFGQRWLHQSLNGLSLCGRELRTLRRIVP